MTKSLKTQNKLFGANFLAIESIYWNLIIQAQLLDPFALFGIELTLNQVQVATDPNSKLLQNAWCLFSLIKLGEENHHNSQGYRLQLLSSITNLTYLFEDSENCFCRNVWTAMRKLLGRWSHMQWSWTFMPTSHRPARCAWLFFMVISLLLFCNLN